MTVLVNRIVLQDRQGLLTQIEIEDLEKGSSQVQIGLLIHSPHLGSSYAF